MATEKMLNSFDIQDSIADDDIVLGYDKSETKVKNFKFGTGIWNWLVDKMTSTVIAKLTTTNKTMIGAINELNSKQQNKDVDYYDGDYTVTPKVEKQELATRQKFLTEDVKIKEIPFFEVSNNEGGQTVFIGKEL